MRLFSWFESTINNTTVGSSSIEFNCINFSFSRKACLAGNGSTILGNQVLSSSQHVFTNFPKTNLLIFLFHQYFSVEKENKFLIGQKRHIFSLTCERLRKLKQIFHNVWWKKFVDWYWENSRKHVVNLTFDCHFAFFRQ